MTARALIALSGRLGSGKSTLAQNVAATLGWPLASFGGYLRGVAAARGLPDTREILQKLGADFLAQEGARLFAEQVLRSASWKPGLPMVAEGVRHLTVVSALRELASPLPLVLVYLQTSEGIRRERLGRRGGKEWEQLAFIEKHSTEADVGDRLREVADLLVDSDQDTSAMVQMVIAALPHES